MLDSDASFFLVPEFQSSRGARRTSRAPLSDLRFGAETGADLCMALMPDPGTHGVAALADLAVTGANVVPSRKTDTDFSAINTADDPTDGIETCEDIHADFLSFDEDDADFFAPEDGYDETLAEAAPFADSPDIRAVTPRRPMRFTFARDAVEHSRASLPSPNLFANVFDDDSLVGPGIDPRLQRSRARARARLAAHEAGLAPEARNLWGDDANEAVMATEDGPETAPDMPTITLTETTASDGSDGQAPRRAVRHLSVTRRMPKPRLAQSEIHDPLQNHLHQVRHALYTPDPEEVAAALASPPQQSLPVRVMAALVTLALLLTRIIAPLRAVLADQARLLRDMATGNGLRLPSRAMAITGLIFALAQTIPPNLM
ncbi:MAG: hypothetical protein O9289_11225 [Rhodobacteraceae bacterium]|nr:hypothetical protein [Paracoccaceae bacterium]MCZ8083768.1 hypothetical protein [Paracoccaceae bacterium]